MTRLLALVFCICPAMQAAGQSVFTQEDALEIGLIKNAQIRLAQAKIGEVYGNTTRRAAGIYPKVTVGGLLIPPTFIGGAIVPIYSAKIAPSLRAFRLVRNAADANIRLAILDFAYRTRLAYLDAQLAEKQAISDFKNYQAFVDLTSRVDALALSGLKGKFDVLSATVDRENASLRYEQAKITSERKRIDLFQLIGLTPGHPAFNLPLQSDFPSPPIPSGTLSELQQLALGRRVDLNILRTLQMAEEQRVIIAYAAFFPELAFITYNKLEAQGPDFLNDLLESTDPTRSPARIEDNPFEESESKNFLQLSWRVFDGFRTYGSVVQRRAILEKRRATTENLEKLVSFQVLQGVENRQNAQNLLTELESTEYEDLVENAKERLGAGFMSRLNYVDIIVQQHRFEFAKEQVRYQFARASAQLQRALGLDVTFEGNPTAPAENAD